MTHEPMSSGATSSEAISPPERDETIPQAHTGFSADAELVIAAIARMQAAMRGERAAFARLQGELEAMAKAIAQARAHLQGDAIKPDADVGGKGIVFAALLDELQLRIDCMQELAGVPFVPGSATAPAAALEPLPESPAAETQDQRDAAAGAPAVDEAVPSVPAVRGRVPTVSDVVSRLGRTSEAPTPSAHPDETTPLREGARDVPTVSMLEAMVEALTASASEAVSDNTSGAAVGIETEGDPATFLFESEAEHEMLSDPAEFLLEPEPTPQATTSAPPQPEVTPAEQQGEPQSEAPAAAPADPLAPLKAMSPEEKIALFS
jgi:hypothetical protein